uniref:Uncharacterized protein n=1 Tax=viral metagenome TaxID=1070528 RepID=A0A6C0K4M8_9ZZZZ
MPNPSAATHMGGSGTVKLHIVQLIPSLLAQSANSGTGKPRKAWLTPSCGQSKALPTGTVRHRKAVPNPSLLAQSANSGTVKERKAPLNPRWCKQLHKFIRK